MRKIRADGYFSYTPRDQAIALGVMVFPMSATIYLQLGPFSITGEFSRP